MLPNFNYHQIQNKTPQATIKELKNYVTGKENIDDFFVNDDAYAL